MSILCILCFSDIVDSYTRDRVLQKWNNIEEKLEPGVWSKTNKFMKKLAKKNSALAESLESAIKAYCNRMLCDTLQTSNIY